MNLETKNAAPPGGAPSKAKSALIGLAILAAGLALTWWFIATRPKAKPRERPKATPIVTVEKMAAGIEQVRIEAMGTVVAADEAAIVAEVVGRITWVNDEMVEGGFVDLDEALVRIDDRDYEAAKKRARAALQKAWSEAKLEEGRRKVAKAESDLMRELDPSRKSSDLSLRGPQRRAANAAISSANAALAQAKLDLERTHVRAPFDAVITEARADVGDHAAPNAVLARLVAIDRFRVKASIRADQLQWIKAPKPGALHGATVIVHASAGGTRQGRLIKLAPELEPKGRMAQVLIAVNDPMALKPQNADAPALLLNEFVRIEIMGAKVDNVVKIPRAALREGKSLWLIDTAGHLRVTPTKILWGVSDAVFVEHDFAPGSRLITSALATPVEGMSLAVEGEGALAHQPPAAE